MQQMQIIACCAMALLCACTSGSHTAVDDTRSSPGPTAHWHLTIGDVAGLVDVDLPPYAEVWNFCVCPGSQGRAAAVWARGFTRFRPGSLVWNEDSRLWQDQASGKTFSPGAQALDPQGKPAWPALATLFPPGQQTAMIIVGPNGPLTRGFLDRAPDLAPDSPNSFPALLLQEESDWASLMNFRRPEAEGILEPTMLLTRFGESGYRKPRIVGISKRARRVPVVPNGPMKGFFCKEEYTRALDPPDFMGGRLRSAITYFSLPDAESKCKVYEQPYAANEDAHIVIERGEGCYDLIAKRSTPSSGQEKCAEIIHVPNILNERNRSAIVVGRCSVMTNLAAIRRGRFLQVLWIGRRALSDDDDILRSLRPESGPWTGILDERDGVPCLLEAHHDGRTWSKPRVVQEIGACVPKGLMAASTTGLQESVALAIWPDREHGFTYSVSSAIDDWSGPCHNHVAIDARNTTLVGSASGFFLFTPTEDGRNRQWRFLEVVKAPKEQEEEQTAELERD